MDISIKASRIFDILVAGGLAFLFINSKDTGWGLIGLGVAGFFAYAYIKYGKKKL